MNFAKESKKPFTAIKTTANHINLSQRYIVQHHCLIDIPARL